jgi:large subunit ribosomal protein L18
MTRREMLEKRHKRVRGSVSLIINWNLAAFLSGSELATERLTMRYVIHILQVSGTQERPRLAVFRSNNHIYAQVVDDEAGNTLAAASTLTPEIRAKLGEAGSNNEEAAKLVGSKIAELCKEKNIELVCFDRGGFRYHGRVRALADAAREGGLAF